MKRHPSPIQAAAHAHADAPEARAGFTSFPGLGSSPTYIDLDTAATQFGPSVKTLRRLIADGSLAAVQFGGKGRLYVRPIDVLACAKPARPLATKRQHDDSLDRVTKAVRELRSRQDPTLH